MILSVANGPLLLMAMIPMEEKVKVNGFLDVKTSMVDTVIGQALERSDYSIP